MLLRARGLWLLVRRQLEEMVDFVDEDGMDALVVFMIMINDILAYQAMLMLLMLVASASKGLEMIDRTRAGGARLTGMD